VTKCKTYSLVLTDSTDNGFSHSYLIKYNFLLKKCVLSGDGNVLQTNQIYNNLVLNNKKKGNSSFVTNADTFSLFA